MASFSNVVSIDLAKVLPDSGQHSTMVAALGSQIFFGVKMFDVAQAMALLWHCLEESGLIMLIEPI